MNKKQLHALGLILDKIQEQGTYAEEIESALELLEEYYNENR